ncbi:MAG: hypothetical protein K2M15_05255 [Oscillospiraceae bacterium]|nr:hypothetical protein [Oscillospiraceae bacterium]MDE7171345.1 hypothetical protein [Oscillospiraceae bacterium]
MDHYKSWSGLNKRLNGLLCEPLKGSISYFLTRYHVVHNSYGRASIRLDGKELVCFSWADMYRQEGDLHALWECTGKWDAQDAGLKEKWDRAGTYCEMDFLSAALEFIELPIKAALDSENYIIKIFAILDRRVGARTLRAIEANGAFLHYPDWVKQFYSLRLYFCR